MPGPSDYEKDQLQAIQIWKAAAPSVLNRVTGQAARPMAWLMRSIVPEKAIQGALSLSNSAAKWLTGSRDILREAGVTEVRALIGKDMALSDRLAQKVHNRAVAAAVAEGAGTGFFGIATAPIDIPAIITLALRTIHKIGVCYGYECKTEADQQFIYNVLSASGANTMEEKAAALAAVSMIRHILATQTWKQMAEKAAESQFGKEAMIVTIRNLAKQLGINLTERRALAAIPVIGAAIGGSVNGWYIKEVGWAARRMFQERWMQDAGKAKQS